MELRHLRYFCAVADHGSFSEAGRQLQVSQSAISEQIADLEREIGGALLNRASGRTRLTQHGQLFLAEARKTLLAADRAVEITNRSLLGEVGSLSIGFFLWGLEVFLRASSATTASCTPTSNSPCMRCERPSRWKR